MPSEVSIMNRLIKNARRRNDPLTPLIDTYFIKRSSSPNRFHSFNFDGEPRARPPGRFSPSSICGCPRAAVLKFTGAKGSIGFDPEIEAVFDDGNWRHARLDWQFYDMEAVLGKDIFEVVSIEEHVSYDKLFIDGHLDAVIKIRGVPYVIDFKGINARGFEYIFKEDKPRESHILQVMTYEKMRRIKRGFLYYECKDDQRTKIFPVDWTADAWEQVQEWCSDIVENMEEQKLPPMDPECSQGRYHFYKCPYAGTCYGSKTSAEIERDTYRQFKGVQETWETNQ